MKLRDNKETSKNGLRLLYAHVVLFVFLYRPNLSKLIGIDGNILLLLLSLPYLYIMMARNKQNTKIKKWHVGMVAFLIAASSFILIRGLLAGEEVIKVLTNSLKILLIIPYGAISAEIINNIKSTGNNSQNRATIIECLIRVGLIQSILAISMIFITPFRQFAKDIYYSGSSENIYISASRLYGICDGDYTYGLQIVHSVLSMISLVYAYYQNKKRYYLYSILLLLTTFLNGRTGLVIFAVSLLYFVTVQLLRGKRLLRKIGLIILIIITIPSSVMIFKEIAPNSYHNIEVMIMDYSESKKGGGDTETEAYKRMIVFPSGVDLVIGKGFRIFAHNGEKFGVRESSDIGFVNDLYLGGLLYGGLLLCVTFIVYTHITRSDLDDSITVILLISFVIANLKGEFLRQPLLISLLVFLIMFLLREEKNGKDIRNSSDI